MTLNNQMYSYHLKALALMDTVIYHQILLSWHRLAGGIGCGVCVCETWNDSSANLVVVYSILYLEPNGIQSKAGDTYRTAPCAVDCCVSPSCSTMVLSLLTWDRVLSEDWLSRDLDYSI